MDFSSFINSDSGQGIMGWIGNIAGSSGGAGGGSGAGNAATKIYKKVRGVGQTMAGAAPSVGQGGDVEKPQYSTLDVTDVNNQMSGDKFLSEKTEKSGQGKQAEEQSSSKPIAFNSPSEFDSAKIRQSLDNAVKMQLTDEKDLSKPFNLQPAQKPLFGENSQNTATVVSDERLKQILHTENPVDCFGKINAYVFKYKPEAQEMYKDKNVGVDDKQHVGVMAQELAANPMTNSSVNKDSNGFLEVDTKSLTMTNTAMIAELARKVSELETKLKETK